jgi:hypothetical protein
MSSALGKLSTLVQLVSKATRLCVAVTCELRGEVTDQPGLVRRLACLVDCASTLDTLLKREAQRPLTERERRRKIGVSQDARETSQRIGVTFDVRVKDLEQDASDCAALRLVAPSGKALAIPLEGVVHND